MLSRRRGEAIRRYLISLGVRPERIAVVAEGETPRFGGGAADASPDQLRRAFIMIDAPLETWRRRIPPGVTC